MKTKTFVLGGKTYCLTTNNSGELSEASQEDFDKLKKENPKLQKYTPDVIKAIKDAPRVGRSSNTKVQIKDDNGNKLTLGMVALCKDDETLTSSKGSTNAPAGFFEAVAGLSGFNKLDTEFQDFVNAQLNMSKSKDDLIKEIEALKKQLGLKK